MAIRLQSSHIQKWVGVLVLPQKLFEEWTWRSQDHLVCLNLLTIFTCQGDITELLVPPEISKGSADVLSEVIPLKTQFLCHGSRRQFVELKIYKVVSAGGTSSWRERKFSPNLLQVWPKFPPILHQVWPKIALNLLQICSKYAPNLLQVWQKICFSSTALILRTAVIIWHQISTERAPSPFQLHCALMWRKQQYIHCHYRHNDPWSILTKIFIKISDSVAPIFILKQNIIIIINYDQDQNIRFRWSVFAPISV